MNEQSRRSEILVSSFRGSEKRMDEKEEGKMSSSWERMDRRVGIEKAFAVPSFSSAIDARRGRRGEEGGEEQNRKRSIPTKSELFVVSHRRKEGRWMFLLPSFPPSFQPRTGGVAEGHSLESENKAKVKRARIVGNKRNFIHRCPSDHSPYFVK